MPGKVDGLPFIPSFSMKHVKTREKPHTRIQLVIAVSRPRIGRAGDAGRYTPAKS